MHGRDGRRVSLQLSSQRLMYQNPNALLEFLYHFDHKIFLHHVVFRLSMTLRFLLAVLVPLGS